MKKIQVRKPGTVRLTSACYSYANCCCAAEGEEASAQV